MLEWLCRIALALAIAAAAGAPLLWYAKQRLVAVCTAVVAWLAVSGLIGFYWLAAGHPPMASMHQVLCLLGACFLPVWLLLCYRHGMVWSFPLVMLPMPLFLIGAAFNPIDVYFQRIPALQSAWFVPHVTAYMLAYALASVAWIMQWRYHWQARSADRARVESLTAGMDQTLRLSVIFMSFGLISGALWADAAWGRCWSWDTKETWAAVTWFCYLLYLHASAAGLNRSWQSAIHHAGFIALVTTFFLVNLWPRLASVLHGYG